MQLLIAFSGLTMCCGALLALLPETSPLRRTALLAAGLLLAAMWLQGLPQFFRALPAPQLPDTWLTPTGDVPLTRQRTPANTEANGYGQAQDLAAP